MHLITDVVAHVVQVGLVEVHVVQESHEVEDHVAHDEVGHVALVGPDHGVEDLVAPAPNGVDGVIFLKKGTMVLFLRPVLVVFFFKYSAI